MSENKKPGFTNNSGKNKQPNGKKPENGKPKFNTWWIFAALFVILIASDLLNIGGSPQKISRQRFEKEMLASNDVERIVIVNNGTERTAEIFLKSEVLNKSKYEDAHTSSTGTKPQYQFTVGDLNFFEERLAELQKDIPSDEQIIVMHETRQNMSQMLYWLLPIGLIIILWVFMFRRMSGGQGGNQIFNVGKSKAQLFDKEKNIKTDFKDVAGLEEAKVEVMEIVDFLKHPKRYTELGGQIPKGALLVGPPGTGKTLLAKAVAGEANVPFYSMSGSDFVEMFVGVGASRVRDLFKQAKTKAPCIVFIDEIDAIGRARGKNPNMGSNDERENTLNQLLTEMDGFGTNSGVIILAATNRADMLDKALMRAGRFDRQIHVELPDLNEREAIFKVHAKPLKMGNDLDITLLAKQTPGFSGADIANVCNEAALIAARSKKKSVDKEDFLAAVDRIIGGLERKNKIISKLEKRTIAFHEAGHATVSWLLEHANPLVKVTIIPRGRALGAAWYLPEERQITTTEQMLDEMCSALGGRASEELTFKKISTGAMNDLEKVTKQAIAMVTYFGMSPKIGNLSYYDSSGESGYNFTKPYSETTAELIDKEVKNIVDEQYKRAITVLKENKEGLDKLAEQLLKKEVIFGDDLEKIFGARKGDEEREKLIGSNGDKKESSEADEKSQDTPNAEVIPETTQETEAPKTDVPETKTPKTKKDKSRKTKPSDTKDGKLD
ncbi:MAG: ATP-dependent zinc metalloprotease FtsH [Bacteroidales bacterium]|jgi:ATP-dependent metalloprotease FtsH|nr:ATP-dependent zinc metalloprotease FtsH [Bacteroidales bacterium]